MVRETAVAAACLGGAYGLHALLVREKGMPLWLRLAPFVVGGSYALFHVVAGAESRWVSMARRNAQRKEALRYQAATLAQRIAIMQALSKPPLPPPPPPEPPGHVAVTLGVPEELAKAAARDAAASEPLPSPKHGPEAV